MNTNDTTERSYNILTPPDGVPVKMWTRGVFIDDRAEKQLLNVTKLPFIYKWVAAMPDCHWGMGATVGSVIPTRKAIIPAAVGVDIGCGMVAARTSLKAEELPDNLAPIRAAIEAAVPHGRTDNGGPNDRGAWSDVPGAVEDVWADLADDYAGILDRHPRLRRANALNHLGTLGTGNHFIEVCLDEDDAVWFMLHSGSRGIGNQIGRYFIELARHDMEKWMINLPDENLAYLPEGTEHFNEYWKALSWAQKFARVNRATMLDAVVKAVKTCQVPAFEITSEVVNCHHNYATLESHYGHNVYVTRKGAVRARDSRSRHSSESAS